MVSSVHGFVSPVTFSPFPFSPPLLSFLLSIRAASSPRRRSAFTRVRSFGLDPFVNLLPLPSPLCLSLFAPLPR